MFQKSVFSPNCNLTTTAITLHTVLPSPPLPLPFTLPSPSLLPPFLSLWRIDRLCLFNPSFPLSPSNGCSIGCGGWEFRGRSEVGGWIGEWKRTSVGGHVWGVVGAKQKPIVLDSTFILSDARFPFILYVWGFTTCLRRIKKDLQANQLMPAKASRTCAAVVSR